MVQVWMVRHGETAWNAQRRLQGQTDTRLSREGRQQAERLRDRLLERSFDTVWSSDLTRAIETANIIFGEPAIDERLRELDFGDLEGATWTELSDGVQRDLFEFDTFAAPNGESVAAMRSRVLSFLDDLPSGDHLLITHGGVVRLVSGLCGSPVYPRPCDVTRIDWTARALL